MCIRSRTQYSTPRRCYLWPRWSWCERWWPSRAGGTHGRGRGGAAGGGQDILRNDASRDRGGQARSSASRDGRGGAQDSTPPPNDTTGGVSNGNQVGAPVPQNSPAMAGPTTPANEYGALFCPLEYSAQKRNDFANAISQFLYHALPTRNYFWNDVSVRQLGLNLPCLDAMTMIFYQLSQPTARAGNPKDIAVAIEKEFYPVPKPLTSSDATLSANDNKPWSLPLPPGDLVEIHSVQDYLKQIFAWSRDEYAKICPPRQLNLKSAIANSSKADLEIYRATLDNSPLAEYFLVQSQIAYCCDGCDRVQLMDRLWFYNYMIEVDLVVDDGNQVPKEDISLQDYLNFIFCHDGKVKRKCNRDCKGETMQRKNAQITRFPLYLIISLERVNKRNGHKHNRPVSVPFSLELSNRGQSDMMYSLNSAIIHSGDLRAGRYSTLVRMVVNGKPSPMNKWVLLKNKMIVEGIEGQLVSRLLTNFACLLMYKRVTDPPNQQMSALVANTRKFTKEVSVEDDDDDEDGDTLWARSQEDSDDGEDYTEFEGMLKNQQMIDDLKSEQRSIRKQFALYKEEHPPTTRDHELGHELNNSGVLAEGTNTLTGTMLSQSKGRAQQTRDGDHGSGQVNGGVIREGRDGVRGGGRGGGGRGGGGHSGGRGGGRSGTQLVSGNGGSQNGASVDAQDVARGGTSPPTGQSKEEGGAGGANEGSH